MILRLIPLLLLAGCGGSLSGVEASCGAAERPFVETWPCVRAGVPRLTGPADAKRQYVATGDVVAERIRAGQITDAEGKLVMSQTLSRLLNEQYGRAGAVSGPTVYQRTGPGTVVAY